MLGSSVFGLIGVGIVGVGAVGVGAVGVGIVGVGRGMMLSVDTLCANSIMRGSLLRGTAFPATDSHQSNGGFFGALTGFWAGEGGVSGPGRVRYPLTAGTLQSGCAQQGPGVGSRIKSKAPA